MTVRLLLAAVLVAIAAPPAFAQHYADVDGSIGGMATTIVPAGGLFLDASKALLRTTSLVGEAQVFGATRPELVAMGGVRQRLFDTRKGELYAQLLLGGATGFSRRCDLCSARTTEFGVGASVALDEQWGIRIRGDIRTGGSAADLFYPTLGVGVTRRWH